MVQHILATGVDTLLTLLYIYVRFLLLPGMIFTLGVIVGFLAKHSIENYLEPHDW